jgi:hypothetical protein
VRFAARTCSDLQGLPLVLLAGLVLLVRRSWSRAWPLGALVVSAVLAGPAFNAISNVPFDGLGGAIGWRFDLLPELLFSLLAAITLQALIAGATIRPLLQISICVALTVLAAVRAWPAVVQAHRPDVEHYKDNVLATLPERAILVASGDAEWGAFLYSRYAEHRRPDVTVIDNQLLRQDWYRQELQERMKVSLEAGPGKQVDSKTMLGRLVATGRPVFFTRLPDSISAAPHDSFGPLMRVWPDGAKRPGLDALLEANRALFASYVLDLPAPADRSAWGHLLYERYERAWRELAERFGEADRQTEASACADRAAKLTPWIVLPVQANVVFQTKCDAGDLSACELLGEHLLAGIGASVDRAKGTALLEKACAGGLDRACKKLREVTTP